jgi:hypothetical protein
VDRKRRKALARLDDAHLHDEIDDLAYTRERRKIERGDHSTYLEEPGVFERALNGERRAQSRLAAWAALILSILIIGSCAAQIATDSVGGGDNIEYEEEDD